MYFGLADARNIGEGFDMLCTLNWKCLNTHLITWRSPSLDINYFCNVPSGIKIKVARKRNYTPHSIQTFHWATLQIKPQSTQYTSHLSRLNKHCISTDIIAGAVWRGDLGVCWPHPHRPRSAWGQGGSAGRADGQAGAGPGPGAGQAGARHPLRGHKARGHSWGLRPRLLPQAAAL